MLIQGIMKCGLGNWIDISEQYVKHKTPKECEEHYFSFYYKSIADFLPKQDDCIIKGPRIVRGDQIEYDYYENKVMQAQERVSEY
jgi:hypothetical protein